MSMIDRYRKKGGFKQLLNLIETSPKDKQDKFLKLLSEESNLWANEIKRRMITKDRILNWAPEIHKEIFTRIQPLTFGMFLYAIEEPKRTELFNVLGFADKRKVEDHFSTKTPTPGEIATCFFKIIAEIRAMEHDGILKYDKFDPELNIDDNIEEKLGEVSGVLSTELNSHTLSHPQNVSTSGPNPQQHAQENEILFLKRKVQQLTQELNMTNTENKILKDKLDQIKRIA